MTIFAFQPALRPALPNVLGCKDYNTQRQCFERIDSILTESALHGLFLQRAIADQGIKMVELSEYMRADFAKRTFTALRACVARKLLNLGHRSFCARLADSALLQWFLHVGEVDQIKVFGKSSSHRFDEWVSEESMRKINDELIKLCIVPQDPLTQRLPFDLKDAVDVSDAFFDTTCVKTFIHFPTDWVLLSDAVRTLMKGTICIRKAGLKNRMPQQPEEFMRAMNKLCMVMAAQRRKEHSKKNRKATLRVMKKLCARVKEHAQAHLDALKSRRAETTLSEAQAGVIAKRLQNVIDKLPDAIKQAHERIIGERRVDNEDKILSLYDEHVEVIVRGKAGAEVEFGNKLSLVESKQGLIIDYQLHRDSPSDAKLVEPRIKRLIEEMKLPVRKLWADRGMFSAANETTLKELGVSSGLCPRNPTELKERLSDPEHSAGMKRRGNTEARIAIFKNVILGNPMRQRSMKAREQACGWAVLSHNLWVLARMLKAGEGEEKMPARVEDAATRAQQQPAAA